MPPFAFPASVFSCSAFVDGNRNLKKILSIYDLRCECCFAMPAIASSVKNREFIYEHNGFLSRAAFITGHPLRITNDRRQFLNKVSSVKSQVKFKKSWTKSVATFFLCEQRSGKPVADHKHFPERESCAVASTLPSDCPRRRARQNLHKFCAWCRDAGN